MSSLKLKSAMALLVLSAAISGCGKEDTTALGVPLQSNPLAGPSQAFYKNSSTYYANIAGNFLQNILGIQTAHASVSTFNTFKICVSEVVWELAAGTAGNSATTPLKPGLLDFSPTAIDAMTIGYLDIAAGTALKNIKFTVANKPDICGGADYAVFFNSNSSGGDKKVTQDMSFKFDFESASYNVENGKAITVYLGDIVNGMAALGTGLNNETIQTVNVGQAN